uniref:Uncharacterized protein n=1 Tax=Oryza nivara TaxID=4536 RepID=A0A0E0FVB6_ORYNI
MEMEMELLVGMWNLSATHDISGARCRVLGHAPEAVVEVDGVGLEVDVVERVGDVGGNLEARPPRREQGEGRVVRVAVEREERRRVEEELVGEEERAVGRRGDAEEARDGGVRSVVEFDDDGGDYGPESFSGLLRKLSELEQSVASWGRKSHHQNHDKKHSPPSSSPLPSQEDRKEKNGSNGDATDKPGDCRDGDDGVGVGLDGSVAVVKQSDDPLGEFRQSERARRRRGPSTPRRVPLHRHTDAATRSWLGPRRRRRELPCSHAVTAAAALLPCSRVVVAVAVAATAATSLAAGPPLPHHPVGRRRRSTQHQTRRVREGGERERRREGDDVAS